MLRRGATRVRDTTGNLERVQVPAPVGDEEKLSVGRRIHSTYWASMLTETIADLYQVAPEAEMLVEMAIQKALRKLEVENGEQGQPCRMAVVHVDTQVIPQMTQDGN